MKYLFLLLGVAQARERLLSNLLGSVTWDIIDYGSKIGEQTGNCDDPGVIHAAMCGQRLLVDSGPPPSCHDHHDESSCQGQADCSWDPDDGTNGECHSSSTDSGHSDGSSGSAPSCLKGDGKCVSTGEAHDYDFDNLKNCIDYAEYQGIPKIPILLQNLQS